LFSITALLLLIRLASPSTFPAYSSSSSSGFYLHVSGMAALLVGLLMLATLILFLNWFYRARKNADLTTWRQRWSPGWAIGSWFLPPVFLWFPYQIMADIWRAGLPPERRQGPANAALPGLWWASWTLAWVTSFQHSTTGRGGPSNVTITSSYSLNFGGTSLSALFAAAAAIALVVIIRKVSVGPVGHALPPSAPTGAAAEDSGIG
jgi:hypothetical protein